MHGLVLSLLHLTDLLVEEAANEVEAIASVQDLVGQLLLALAIECLVTVLVFSH